MLHLSEKAFPNAPDLTEFEAYKIVGAPVRGRSLRRFLTIILLIGFALLFFPWTQNIQTNGRVTTLRPEQRPQTIQATIAGRIEKWHVFEGQKVRRGDTILTLSEVKTEYLDQSLVQRVQNQVDAKSASVVAYSDKSTALDAQISAISLEKTNKKTQLQNKILQAKLKAETAKRDIETASQDAQIADNQLVRTKELYQKGLKPLTDLEQKTNKKQETDYKLLKAQNEFSGAQQEVENTQLALQNNENEFAAKLAKATSERQSAVSDRFDATSSLQKLEVEATNYAARRAFSAILAPQDCFITKAIKAGIGEIVKDGEAVVAIMPANFQLAVEMFVEPIDYPLISIGRAVRFVFDGWPAVVFSGWPNVTFGTFEGNVVGIDQNISENGKFRILVAPDPTAMPWPAPLRPGGGARCITMLNDVTIYFELWRQLNGFPPDFYDEKNNKGKIDKITK
jgi:membrane fusion protein, adhesin transport system